MRSRYPDADIPDVPLSQYVLAGAAARHHQPAMIDGLTHEVLTFGELAAHVERVAAWLGRAGLAHGDVVAIASPNSVWYPVVFHGIVSAGCVASPVNPVNTADEIASQLRDANARVIFAAESALPRVLEAVRQAPAAQVVVIGGAPGFPTLREITDEPLAPGRPPAAINPAADLAALPYSSGTTGLPKGVMLTHRNLVANIAQFRALQDVRPGTDRLIAVLPFFHIYGLTVLMNFGLQAGVTVVTMPRFDLDDFLRIVQDERVTRACVAS